MFSLCLLRIRNSVYIKDKKAYLRFLNTVQSWGGEQDVYRSPVHSNSCLYVKLYSCDDSMFH
jgi:hypothetical protein